MQYEKILLDSFFKRFNNFVNSKRDTDKINRLQALQIKKNVLEIINTDNIKTVFNMPTIRVYQAFKKGL